MTTHKTVVIGANRGIGLELTKALTKRAAVPSDVVAVSRKSSPELGETGAAVIEGIDVSHDGAEAELADRLKGTTIDLLLYVSGIYLNDSAASIATGDVANVRLQLEVNAVAPLRFATRLAAKVPHGGKIALLTSRMGSIADNGSGGQYGYRMSKAALNAAGKSLAVDLKPRGIAVVLLHPGFVQTDMTGGSGNMTAVESARLLLERISELTLARTGEFRHATGEILPW
jgi:NAD(P)-dependent dehydrogenase (short-subunit alcohol dehydrogenase family)